MKKCWFISLFIFFSLGMFPQTIELFAQSYPSSDNGYLQINDAIMVTGGHYQVPVVFSGDSIVGVESTLFSSDGLSFDFENRNTVTLNEWYWGNTYSFPILDYDKKTNNNTVHWGLFCPDIFYNYFAPVRISIVVNPNLGDKYEEYLIFGQTIFTKSDPKHTQYYATGSSAKITVFNGEVWGGENGTLDIFKILDLSSGKIMTIDQRSLAYYDLNGDLKVTSFDALLRVCKHFNTIDSYPVETGNYYYDGGCGLGITTTKGEVIVQQSNNSVMLTFSDSLTNGDLSFKLPKGAWIEKGLGFNANNSISDPKDGITKMSFVASNPIKNGSSIIIHGAKIEEITLTGTLNNGKSIILKHYGITDVPEEKSNSVPTEFDLSQNYPNPFNPSTTISYAIPTDGFVSLKIYDMLGKEVATLINEEKPAGDYTISFNANNLASGMYIYKISSGPFNQTKKMILMK
ncbi:hypothetical protein AUJ22_01025 [Candidatus Nomurabacteria bacterium CG1_02_31_12]|uniref:Secretion system C-terminal sorting domain-containing protein n=3 Tax=Candidatus Nomuraibacteriota TaxID=1752729 RepID=A0A1J4V0Z1_9BACT|nr:MAG: hypothetical protein AUJ22_01025 [Candidatus Nomurabacteria bacterium CG1_02_31_12]